MSDNPTSPLLGGPSTEPNGRPRSQRSSASTRSKRSQKSSHSDESTPLLARGDSYRYGDEEPEEASSPAASSLQALQDGGSSGKSKSRIRLGSIFALTTLMLLVVVVLAFVFAAPAVVKEYAEGAAVFTPTDLSIDSFTASGVKARVQGNFVLDGSRVGNNAVRDLGRAATWIARAAETKPSKVQVYLPEYGNILFGDAEIPSIVVSIRNGEKTDIDFIADVEPGDVDGIRRIANDWIDGRLGQLRVMGKANVGLKSGIFSLGTQSISETITFKGKDIPTMPKYNITKFNVHEADLSDSEKAMAADVSIEVFNKYPITFTVPPLAFDILVPACTAEEPYILLANATTQSIEVKPQNFITVDARGLVRHLPETLISVCPDSNTSPLDSLLADFMNGVKTTVFVRGAQIPSPDTPSWISDLMKDVIVPVPFTGHSMDNLIQDFSMTNVHFGLPNPLADPNTPESQPKLSATIKVTANLPSEINFPVSVSKVRSLATVFYKKKQMGILDLHKWQKAKSKRVEPHGDHPPGLIVESTVKNAPLNITDDDVFTDVVQALLFGGENVVLGVEATVDIETSTVLGKLVIRDIPAKGVVPLKR